MTCVNAGWQAMRRREDAALSAVMARWAPTFATALRFACEALAEALARPRSINDEEAYSGGDRGGSTADEGRQHNSRFPAHLVGEATATRQHAGVKACANVLTRVPWLLTLGWQLILLAERI